MSTAQEPDDGMRALVHSILGDDVQIRIEMFSSGAVAIDIQKSGRHLAVDGTSTRCEWGVSLESSPETGFLRHDHTLGSLEAALRTASGLLEQQTS